VKLTEVLVTPGDCPLLVLVLDLDHVLSIGFIIASFSDHCLID
jgi:hypothetical protein